MGIPGFFAWLQRKYPGIVKDVEAKAVDFNDPVGADAAGDSSETAAATATTGNNGGDSPLLGGDVGGFVFAAAAPPDSHAAEAEAAHRAALSFQCRNLYLDTNGIIHAGTHPPGRAPPTTEAGMFAAMHAVLDRIVALARPSHLVFIAVDGVAPRAKINQQRARRFVAARERTAAHQATVDALNRLQAEAAAPALELGADPEAAAAATAPEWDHNAISPGTPFMDRMMASMKAFVARRMAAARVGAGGVGAGGVGAGAVVDAGADAGAGAEAGAGAGGGAAPTPRGWASPTLRVVFSDCSVPGEGEHKIMDFIRREKAAAATAAASGDLNTEWGVVDTAGADADAEKAASSPPACTHCIYGEDADLIMLALALHDPRVRVLRQLQVFRRQQLVVPDSLEATPYAVVDVGQLRRHLDRDLFRPFKESLFVVNAARATGAKEAEADSAVGALAPLEFDLERAIDDFVLLGFMIGNDFVPALPALDIRLGALELLLEIHTEVFASSGWLTDGARLNFAGLAAFLERLASVETALLQQNRRHRAKSRKASQWNRTRAKKPVSRTAASGAKPCHKWAAGRNCRKGARCAFLHGDHVPLYRFEQRKLLEMEQMLRHYLADDSPSGEVELDMGDVVFVNSVKSMKNLYDLCNKLGLDYSKEDVEDTGDVFVAKYVAGDVTAAERRKRRFVEYLISSAANEHDLQVAVRAAELRDASDACDAAVDVSESGFRQRFYELKLRRQGHGDAAEAVARAEDDGGGALRERVQKLCASYVEGLQWVLAYYHSGCAAWDWYYPGHYAPFAVELAAFLRSPAFCPPVLQLGKPLRPFEQLMAILPPSSARHLLPPPLAAAVDSPALADVYPPESGTDFEVDPNSQEKEYLWLPLLPFLDTSRVVAAARAPDVLAALTPEEAARNSFGAAEVLLWGGAAAWSSRSDSGATAEVGCLLPGEVTGVTAVAERPWAPALPLLAAPLCSGSLDLTKEADVGGVDKYAFWRPQQKVLEQTAPDAATGFDDLGGDDAGDDDLFGGDGGGRGELLGDDAEDDSVFAADFADTARQQKFAPLGTLDAAMEEVLEECGPEHAFLPARGGTRGGGGGGCRGGGGGGAGDTT